VGKADVEEYGPAGFWLTTVPGVEQNRKGVEAFE
jgi:hypothetical protein